MEQEKQNKDENFNFFLPVELTKGKDSDEWRIKGLASTEDMDLQGEVVRVSGLDISPLQNGKGLFNWDHKPGAHNILGVVDQAEIKDNKLHVEGYLFKNGDQSKAVYNILSSLKDKDKNRVGLSIEGKILRRAGWDQKTIASARIDKIAVTMDPVNPNTWCTIAKSFNVDSVELNNGGDNLFPIDYSNDTSQTDVNISEQKNTDSQEQKIEKSDIDLIEIIKTAAANILIKKEDNQVQKSAIDKITDVLTDSLSDEEILIFLNDIIKAKKKKNDLKKDGSPLKVMTPRPLSPGSSGPPSKINPSIKPAVPGTNIYRVPKPKFG